MCNAWNHPSNCRCGWGGDGHLGQGGFRGHSSLTAAPYGHSGFRSLHSFTNPNARCPVCAQPVYFYQSPHGGRVFFDELGGDWPKHPCTDKSSASKGRPTARSTTHNLPTAESLARTGWSPMPVTRLETHPFAKYAKVRGVIKGRELELWTSCCDLQDGAPHFYREQGNGVIAVQSISVTSDGTMTVIGYTAYLRQMDFDASRKAVKSVQVVRGKKRIPTSLKKIKRPNRNTKPAQQGKAIFKFTTPVTSLSLAFERARSRQQ